jgi:hypothetical protein
MTLVARCAEDVAETLDMGDGLVFRAIERDGSKPPRALDGELRGRSRLRLCRRRRCDLPARRFPQRMVVGAFNFAKRLRPRLFGRKLGTEPFRHAAQQRGEFQPPHEAGQCLGVRLSDRCLGQRYVERDVAIEDHEIARQARLIRERDQVLAALLLLDLRGA